MTSRERAVAALWSAREELLTEGVILSVERAIEQAVAFEREACATIVEQGVLEGSSFCHERECVAAAIRARRARCCC
jgi:hypothetical protein